MIINLQNNLKHLNFIYKSKSWCRLWLPLFSFSNNQMFQVQRLSADQHGYCGRHLQWAQTLHVPSASPRRAFRPAQTSERIQRFWRKQICCNSTAKVTTKVCKTHSSRWGSICMFASPVKYVIDLSATCVCSLEEEVLSHPLVRTKGIKLGDRQIERLRKAAEKAEQAQAKIEKRKQEWEQLWVTSSPKIWVVISLQKCVNHMFGLFMSQLCREARRGRWGPRSSAGYQGRPREHWGPKTEVLWRLQRAGTPEGECWEQESRADWPGTKCKATYFRVHVCLCPCDIY